MTDREDRLDARRKRLRVRSWHRGTREMDILLGRFADQALSRLSDAQLDRYEALGGEIKPSTIKDLAGLGLIDEGAGRIAATPQGRIVLNGVLRDLLA